MRDITFFLSFLIITLYGTGASCGIPSTPKPKELHTLAESGNYEAVEAALKAGVEVDLIDDYGRTPLFYAVSSSSISIAEKLLNEGADPNHQADDGNTPLLFALTKGNLQMVSLLIENGALINATGEDGFTPLTIATSKMDKDLFDLLIKMGADPDVSFANCDTTLIKSIKQDDVYYFDKLIETGVSPNIKGKNGNTPLMVAVFYKKLEIVKKLLSTGANVNDTNNDGYSALTFSSNVENINREITELLIENGADVNQIAKDGLTPLKVACLIGNTDMAVYLYEKGAKPDFDDSSDEGVELNGILNHVLGDYFLAMDDCDKARASYNKALGYYQNTANKCSKDAKTLAWKKAGAYSLMALAGSLQDISTNYYSNYMSNIQSRQMAEISAMQYATKSNTGINGYNAYISKYNESYTPTYRKINTSVPIEPSVDSNLSQKSAYLKEKKKLYEDRITLIKKILECLDKYPAGKELHDCINSISVISSSSSTSSSK